MKDTTFYIWTGVDGIIDMFMCDTPHSKIYVFFPLYCFCGSKPVYAILKYIIILL